MSDEAPKSVLAQKALAQKAQREAAAEKEKQQSADAAKYKAGVRAKWAEVESAYSDAIAAVNRELHETGTSLGVEFDAKSLVSNVGRIAVTVKREGARLNIQRQTITLFESGRLEFENHLSRAEDAFISECDVNDIGPDEISALLRSFVEAALS